MSRAILWIHADCLHPQQPALAENEGSPAIFIWDESLIRRRQLSLKRIVFIYESLLDLPVTIRRGQVSDQLIYFAQENGAARIVTTRSISPGFRRIVRALRQRGWSVDLRDQEPFVELSPAPDLRRFSRYWRQAQPHLAEYYAKHLAQDKIE